MTGVPSGAVAPEEPPAEAGAGPSSPSGSRGTAPEAGPRAGRGAGGSSSCSDGSTVTANRRAVPSTPRASRIASRALVSRRSLTNDEGTASSRVSSTRPSGCARRTTASSEARSVRASRRWSRVAVHTSSADPDEATAGLLGGSDRGSGELPVCHPPWASTHFSTPVGNPGTRVDRRPRGTLGTGTPRSSVGHPQSSGQSRPQRLPGVSATRSRPAVVEPHPGG